MKCTMVTDVAYLKKNHFFIFLRFLRYIFFRVLVRLAPRSDKLLESAFFYSDDDPGQISKYKVQEFKEVTGLTIITNSAKLAKELNLELVSKPAFNDQSVLILVNNFSLLSCLRHFKSLRNFRIVDKTFWSHIEAETWVKLLVEFTSKKKQLAFNNTSVINFDSFINNCVQKQKAVCFTTGPSFDLYQKFNFDGFLKVICNSIIKDEDFLDHIGGPDILAFADPVFHFGFNPYAKEFRAQVFKMMNKWHKCFIFTTEENAVALNYFLPMFSNRIIGLKLAPRFNVISNNNLTIFPTQNILTLIMLPLAASLSEEVYFLGSDGRESKENYFWKHSSSVQFVDKMKEAFSFHPSFFRDRIYTDYYLKHCELLKDQINFFESKQKKFISLAPSFIPILREKFYLSLKS